MKKRTSKKRRLCKTTFCGSICDQNLVPEVGRERGIKTVHERFFDFFSSFGPSLGPKCLQERPKRFPRAPRISNFAHPYSTLDTFSKIARCALQVLLDCFLAALGALLDAFWAQLGLSWVPLGLNLGPLGRLIGPTWASWNALDLHLAPLER